LMFMHGEDCAAIRRSRHTRPRPAHKRARQCLSPSCVSNDGAFAHGRTLNSRCHRTAGAFGGRRRTCFLQRAILSVPSKSSEASAIRSSRVEEPVLLRQGFGGHPTLASRA
jgi:hypothetical protein